MKRADIAFDIYKDHSIKSTARETRGFGGRVKVSCKKSNSKGLAKFS